MRRTGYNALNNSEDAEGVDEVDGKMEDLEEAMPFTEYRAGDEKTHKRTLCLVFTLFFGGLVCLPNDLSILLLMFRHCPFRF